MMKYTSVPTDTFDKIQLNSGVLLSDFTPDTGSFDRSNIIGCTSGGISFSDTPTFQDFGDDIDNMPKNTKQLKKIIGREIKLSGTYITVDTDLAKSVMASADVTGTKITARDVVSEDDFKNIWWVGDYSKVNTDGETGNAGYIAIKLLNALSTGGFSITSAPDSKGNVAFEYTAHYDMANPDKVPYEVYIRQGTEA